MSAYLIFTDLDGTLLDHDTYGYGDALPALELVKKRNVPLVLCTSKTREETSELRDELGLSHPFITENGGGIFIPADSPIPPPSRRTDQPRIQAYRAWQVPGSHPEGLQIIEGNFQPKGLFRYEPSGNRPTDRTE